MKYLTPEMEIQVLKIDDVIVTSSTYTEGETDLEDGVIITPPAEF